MPRILKYAARWDIDNQFGEIALIVEDVKKPVILKYSKQLGHDVDFLAILDVLKLSKTEVDIATKVISSSGWVLNDSSEGGDVPFPW